MITLKNLLIEVQNRCFETPAGAYMSNPDPKYKRLVTFANQAVRKILDAHDWNMLIYKALFDVVDGVDYYDLPYDFYRLVSDTTYKAGSYFPVTFPDTDQSIEKAKQYGGSGKYLGRFIGNSVEFVNVPPGTVSFMYVRKSMVTPESDGGDEPLSTIDFQRDSDIFLPNTSALDELLILGTQALYMRARGAEGADVVVSDYTYQLKQQIYNDTGARTLNDVCSEHPRVLWKHNPDYNP